MLAFSGCRISEALSLTDESIDFEAQSVVIKCLKKRGKMVFRAIPLPPRFLRLLRRWFTSRKSPQSYLWTWSRMTAYRHVCDVMIAAGIRGSYATPKGLRHAFGVTAIQAGIPLTLIQRWLGHADIKTTAIYTSAMGPEEREIASRMWRKGDGRSGAKQSNGAPVGQMPEMEAEEEESFFEIGTKGPEQAEKRTIPGDLKDNIPRINLVNELPIERKNAIYHALYCYLIQIWIDCNGENHDFSVTYQSSDQLSSSLPSSDNDMILCNTDL